MKLNIGKNIREKRKQMGLTQEQLAYRLGVAFQSVSRWEKGTTYPDIEKLPEIARLFDTTTDALLGLDDASDIPYPEVMTQFENALMNGDEDEICRLLRMIRHEYREEVLSDTYAGDYPKIHSILKTNYTRVLRQPEVLSAMRDFAEDYLQNGKDNIFRMLLIGRMAVIEDDEHIDDFIEKYSSDNLDISRTELLKDRYAALEMTDKYNEYRMYKNYDRLRLFLEEECDCIEDADVRLKVLEEKFTILNILSGIESDENYPVSGNGEADVWSGVRYRIAFDYAAHLALSGQYEKAIRALEDTRDMIEKLFGLPKLTAIGCRSALFGDIRLELFGGRKSGLIMIETPRGEGEYPYKNVIPMDVVSLGYVPYWALTKHRWHEYFKPIENDPRYQEILRWAEGLPVKTE